MKYIRLGDLLVKSGTITQEKLDEALKLQADTGERLGTVLQSTALSPRSSSSTP